MFINIIKKKSLFYCFIVCFSGLGNFSYAQVQNQYAYDERIEQLELEVRRLTGDVETLKYKNKNLEIKLNGLRKEVDVRFKLLEEETKNNKPQESGALDTQGNIKSDDDVAKIINPSMEINEGSATVIYDAAMADLQRKEYTKAAEGFQKIIDAYPEHSLTPNSYYWLGETYYARRDYSKAALTFLEGKKKFPNNSKAGHNLLKLGLSLHYLKQDQDACLTFDEVEKHYLTKDKSLVEALEKSREKVNCAKNNKKINV